VDSVEAFDFAVLILTPDDLVESKGQTVNSPRDNVLFELGLFMGRLGRARTFAVHNRDIQIKLPTDLAGVTLATYPSYSGNNLAAQVSIACTPILNAIGNQGRLRRQPLINPNYDSDMRIVDGKFEFSDVFNKSTIVIVVGDGVWAELLDRPVAGLLRDEIARRGGGDRFKRALIIGYSCWASRKFLHANATISIGGEGANALSGEILKDRKAAGGDRYQGVPSP
jgi:hypothetical protein